MTPYPDTITVCGVELRRGSPGCNQSSARTWFTTIGLLRLRISEMTRGHWIVEASAPVWLEPITGQADDEAAAIAQATSVVQDYLDVRAEALENLKRAEANWLVAGEWLEERENHD